jgi:MYXO-CTERM domain-containing protein
VKDPVLIFKIGGGTNIPEPASAALVLMGLVGLCGRIRRRSVVA